MIPLIPHPPAIIVAQSSPYVQDIQGWNGTNWEMSQADVQKLFPQMRIESPEKMSGSYTLDDMPCDARFIFDGGKLSHVNIRYTGKDFRTNAYRFSKLLKSKYGTPTEKEDTLVKIGLLAYQWLMPTTQIRIDIFAADEIDAKNWVNLNYSPRSEQRDI